MVIIPFINEIYMFNYVILSVVKEELLIWEQILNGLPVELKNETNTNVFKKKLKGYLICNVFYS
jgi:hypothetical protein